jgi:zinc transport system substrate-binding protein
METSTLLGQSTGAASGHDHGLKDPHIWTDPVNVKKFMQEFTAKLVQLYPRYEISFTNHFQQFAEELDELDRKLQALFQSISSKHFLVFHPSWGYFADRYGLVQVPIELEGKTPSAKELASVIDYAKKYKIKHVFVQQQFSRKNAQTVAHAIGGEVVTVDPLAEDYMNNLIKVAQLLAGSMK